MTDGSIPANLIPVCRTISYLVKNPSGTQEHLGQLVKQCVTPEAIGAVLATCINNLGAALTYVGNAIATGNANINGVQGSVTAQSLNHTLVDLCNSQLAGKVQVCMQDAKAEQTKQFGYLFLLLLLLIPAVIIALCVKNKCDSKKTKEDAGRCLDLICCN